MEWVIPRKTPEYLPASPQEVRRIYVARYRYPPGTGPRDISADNRFDPGAGILGDRVHDYPEDVMERS